MAKSQFSRRRFLGGTAGLAAGMFSAPNILVRGQNGASKRLNLAIIGANGKGIADTKGVTLEHNVVALVDVDQTRLEEAAKTRETYHQDAGAEAAKAPKLYTDFRKMYDEMSDEIDGVIISTPDHTHYPAAMWAIKHGKHVCVQKPLCNYIEEVRNLHAAAREAGVVTQMGNQGRTMEGQRFAKEWIEQGAIGELQEIRLWTNRPIWPQGPFGKKVTDAPANLDWDLWLSCEPSEPYFEMDMPEGVKPWKNNFSVHPFSWRGWWQFGSGALGDMGCHIMDATFSILGQLIPEKIEAESSIISDTCAPAWSKLVYHMPAGKHKALKVTWHDGSMPDGTPVKPERPEFMSSDLAIKAWDKAKSGMAFIGTDGVVFEGEAYCQSPVIYPEDKFTDTRIAMKEGKIVKTEERSVMPNNPQGEWAYHIVNGGKPTSNFDYSCPLTEFVLLGNLAVRSQETVSWDKDGMKVTNIESANQYVKRPSYRDGWLPA